MPLILHWLLLLSVWFFGGPFLRVLPLVDGRAAVESAGGGDGARAGTERAETERMFADAPHWQAMAPAERERFHRFNAIYTAARAAGDAETAWAAAADFVRDAAPSELRTNTAILLAKHWGESGRRDDAAALLKTIGPGEPGSRRASLALGQLTEWDREDDTLDEVVSQFRTPEGKVLRGDLELHDHYTAARLIASAGDHERARLYYFAAAPDPGDAPAVRQYVINGFALARDLGFRGRPKEALNFQLNLMRKYPAEVGAAGLARGVTLARGADNAEAADALVDLLRDNFADARETVAVEGAEAERALLRGDREAAVDHLRRLADHPVATDAERASASKRLRMLGVRDTPAEPRDLAPRPDPKFGEGS